MYLFGDSYFETNVFKEIFQITFIIYIMADIFIFWFTSRQSNNNSEKRKEDKGSCFIIVAGTIVIVILNLVCRNNAWGIMPKLIYWCGIIFIIIGVILRIYSVLILGKAFTVSVQVNSNQKIIQSGPYKYIRHPAYSGSILSLIGISLAFRSSIGVVGTLIIIACIYGYRIKVEESMLATYFKTSYQEYKKHTKRIIPFVW
jgi:protein-S-isoprenylcysteine O-methyltransferase Ste14